jgi:hypothetical protein
MRKRTTRRLSILIIAALISALFIPLPAFADAYTIKYQPGTCMGTEQQISNTALITPEEAGFTLPDEYEFIGWQVKGTDRVLSPGQIAKENLTLVPKLDKYRVVNYTRSGQAEVIYSEYFFGANSYKADKSVAIGCSVISKGGELSDDVVIMAYSPFAPYVTGTDKNFTYKIGDTVIVKSSAELGYTCQSNVKLNGWIVNGDLSNIVKPGQSIKITENMVLGASVIITGGKTGGNSNVITPQTESGNGDNGKTESAKPSTKPATSAKKSPTVSSVKAGKGSVSIDWKLTTDKAMYKYQIRIKQTTAKRWNYFKVNKKISKLTITKLKKGKKYKTQIRTLYKKNGKTLYGKWSKAKTLKIK